MSSVYSIVVSEGARRELLRLPKPIIRRVAAAINALADQPRPRGSIKLRGSERVYRVRVGSYRVIYEVDDDAQSVFVTRIRHRKEAYD